MVELLLKGQTYVDTRQCKNNITSLAECLQIRLENIETQSKGKGKVRLRNMSEIMKPGFSLNNNAKVKATADGEKEFYKDSEDYFECEKMKDYTEEVGNQSDGWMSKPHYVAKEKEVSSYRRLGNMSQSELSSHIISHSNHPLCQTFPSVVR